ncbi:hypothetical protein JOC77_004104 [Peribacillus deserti]|uniref:Uncharacterized protein n=1 Tax=Peribacillus deserti TaxID=673318 RepID=A0ABS2QN88_9BACI|nr:hypothetical protein [Peribacillus deserti]MBM7694629.1 hypothetical protein [Peribacillus deserti]
MELKLVGLLVSFAMTLLLFSTAYAEAIKISNTEGKVDGTFLILSVPLAFLFSIFTIVFQK